MLFTIIFTRLVLDGIAGVKFLIELKPKHTIAIINAHFSFYRNLGLMLRKREENMQKDNYYKTKSIVWSYFVLGKKHFKDL